VSSPIARRYARALYMIGVEENRLDGLAREIKMLGDTVVASKELATFLSNPVVSQAARTAVMTEVIARTGVSVTTRNFAMLLTDRRRGALLPDISDALATLADERAGKLRATVTSAVALSEPQLQKMRMALEKLTGKAVSLTQKIDPSLIGGVVTRIGDKVYDGSLKARLEDIRQLATTN
jgi:F-type H+-transporting ATPase subunit delta